MIKNKLKIGLVAIFAAVFGLADIAGASSLTYSTDTIVDLSTADFTIKAGSTAETVVVNADDIVVTMAAGDIFTVTNSARQITVTGNNPNIIVSNTCSGTLGTAVITSTTGTGTYTISSASNQCATVTGGGGGSTTNTVPTNISISIAGGAAAATTADVTLTLAAANTSQMMISNNVNFTDAVWETYVTSKAWTLTSGNGTKTVYAKFRDSAGNTSTAVSDTITLSVAEEETATPETPETPETPATPETPITPSSEVLDGDIIQCKSSSNPFAVYIVKIVGSTKYIRHIVSIEIFNHYKHLKWENLKQVSSIGEYSLSGWVRYNTGLNGTAGPADKVYEINGDQTKHWINMTAEQFLSHGGSDPAIYSVNEGELNLYTKGPDVMSL